MHVAQPFDVPFPVQACDVAISGGGFCFVITEAGPVSKVAVSGSAGMGFSPSCPLGAGIGGTSSARALSTALSVHRYCALPVAIGTVQPISFFIYLFSIRSTSGFDDPA